MSTISHFLLYLNMVILKVLEDFEEEFVESWTNMNELY